MYEWTVQESVFVRTLMPDASAGLVMASDNTRAVVVKMPNWDGIGTVYFNEEKWYTGYGQSQLREMLSKAREIGGDVIFQGQDQALALITTLRFEMAPKPHSRHQVTPAHADTVNAGKEWCENCEKWFPIGTHGYWRT